MRWDECDSPFDKSRSRLYDHISDTMGSYPRETHTSGLKHNLSEVLGEVLSRIFGGLGVRENSGFLEFQSLRNRTSSLDLKTAASNGILLFRKIPVSDGSATTSCAIPMHPTKYCLCTLSREVNRAELRNQFHIIHTWPKRITAPDCLNRALGIPTVSVETQPTWDREGTCAASTSLHTGVVSQPDSLHRCPRHRSPQRPRNPMAYRKSPFTFVCLEQPVPRQWPFLPAASWP